MNVRGLLHTVMFAAVLAQTMTSTATFAELQCPVPDHSFKAFVQRFESDVMFQQSRIILPMVSRSGDYTYGNAMVELWNLEKLKSLGYPLILSQEGRTAESVTESIVLSTKRYVEIFQDGPPDTDSYRMLYKFRNVGGCWFLEEVHDKSQ